MNKKSRVGVALVIVAFVVAGVIAFVLAQQFVSSGQRYPFAVAFTDPDTQGSKIIRLCDRNGHIREIGRVDPKYDIVMPLGYNRQLKSWIVWAEVGLGPYVACMVKMGERKQESIRLFRGDPKDVDPAWDGKLQGDNLYVTTLTPIPTSFLEGCHAGFRCYTLSGTLKYDRRLPIADNFPLDIQYTPDVSSNGLVTLAYGSNADNRQVFLFDVNGKQLKVIGLGDNPSFDPKGQRIAYWQMSNPSRAVIIYDIKSSKKRTIPLNHPPWSLAEPVDVRWSPDSSWLFCSYMIGYPPHCTLYAVNIAGNKLRWVKYPMRMESDQWAAADPKDLK